MLLVWMCLWLLRCGTAKGSLLQIEEGFEELATTNEVPNYLREAIAKQVNVKNREEQDQAHCTTCLAIMTAGKKVWKSSGPEALIEFGVKVCGVISDYNEVACRGFVQAQAPTLDYILRNGENTSPERICSIKLQDRNCVDPNYEPWSVNIPDGISPVIAKKNATEDTKKVLHLTDFHYDPLYQPGSNGECDAFVCCEVDSGIPDNPANGAGYWGDYHVCDTPWHAIIDGLTHIKREHKEIDWVYYTGDIISHRSWATSKADNTKTTKQLLQQFEDTFGSTPVYPILGNHEPHPTDLYSSENVTEEAVSTHWMFDLVAEEWSRWLPEETKATIRQGGYYTVLVKPGFRIIGLNSNVCYVSNLWLIHKDKDPYGQLQWLAETLLKAERNEEVVHILSHIPPGDRQCFKQWAHEFRRIVERFSNTITGQFNGHSHLDELRVFYSTKNPEQVINTAFNGGSFTTFVGLNPNYRVYDVESEHYYVSDYHHWTYNLTQANLNATKNPDWFKLYSFKEAYGLTTLELSDYNHLLQKMAENPLLIEQYRRFEVRESAVMIAKECNKDCLAQMLCRIASVEFDDSIQCKALKQKFYQS